MNANAHVNNAHAHVHANAHENANAHANAHAHANVHANRRDKTRRDTAWALRFFTGRLRSSSAEICAYDHEAPSASLNSYS